MDLPFLRGRRRRQAWELAAHVRGGLWQDGRFECGVGECRALAEMRGPDGRGSRIRVAFLLGSGPAFAVATPAAAPDWTEERVGDLVLRCPPAEHDAVHGLFGPSTVRLVERLRGARPSIVSDGRVITFTSARVLATLDQIEAALDLAGQLAHFDLATLAAMRSLCDVGELGCEYDPPRGTWDQRTMPRTECHVGHRSVRIEPRLVAGHRMLVATSPTRRNVPPILLGVNRHGALSDVLPRDALPPDALAHLPVAGPAAVAYDGAEVQVRWERVDVSPARLQAGVLIVGAFAAHVPGREAT